ncbi:MAG: hypothetical protein U0271_39115 [Polyangiaceae bacterium]
MMRRYGLAQLALLPMSLSLAALVASGCEDEPIETQNPDPEEKPKAVPAAPALLETSSVCAPLAEGETLRSVSPEGHAWLVSGSRVRVLDAFGDVIAEETRELDVGEILELSALGARDAAILGSDGLYRLEDFSLLRVAAPEGFAGAGSLCGDPAASGVLVASGEVFERRSDGWWGWSAGDAEVAGPSRVLRRDAECRATDELMWLVSTDGALYRTEAQSFTTPKTLATLRDAAVTEGFVAALDDNGLLVGTADGTWQAWEFSGEVPTKLAAAAGAVWMVADGALLRFDGTNWARAETEADGALAAIGAHAGGVWVEGASTICHAAVGVGLRLEGVRPNERSVETERSFLVRASDGAESIEADLDGVAVPLAFDDESGALGGTATLESLGWHALTVKSGDATRTIALKRAPDVERSFATDIAPIYAANCAGAGCHVAGGESPPDLSTYEAWVARAEKIRARVIEGKNMPPAANRGPDWGDDDVAVIDEWLEGGMLP